MLADIDYHRLWGGNANAADVVAVKVGQFQAFHVRHVLVLRHALTAPAIVVYHACVHIAAVDTRAVAQTRIRNQHVHGHGIDVVWVNRMTDDKLDGLGAVAPPEKSAALARAGEEVAVSAVDSAEIAERVFDALQERPHPRLVYRAVGDVIDLAADVGEVDGFARNDPAWLVPDNYGLYRRREPPRAFLNQLTERGDGVDDRMTGIASLDHNVILCAHNELVHDGHGL